MKPINAFELKKSYQSFLLHFGFLTLFSIFCIYLFFAASDYEYVLLEKKVKETEKLSLLRKEINTDFDIILMRFRELSKYRQYNANELSKQGILLEEIQNSNYHIKDLIKRKPKATLSFELYEKLNNQVSAMANLQDSLFTTRYTIESSREQLENCLKVNKSAINRIRGGRIGR